VTVKLYWRRLVGLFARSKKVEEEH
jgi:hypothetical protein